MKAPDRGEQISRMEPLRFSESSRHRAAMLDLAVDLAQKAAGFRRSLPPATADSIARLVRSMNCYYSNLIEGHDTHPVDVVRALAADYSHDSRKRDLQLEAKAHIEVQAWIDRGGLAGRATSPDGLREIHRRFRELLPVDLLWVAGAKGKKPTRVVPGEFRRGDVIVGHHVPVSPGAVPRFLERFHEVYGSMGKAEVILSAAAAHHRLAWIHPFQDGNGRVARLMSHAMLLEALDTGGVWSVARGLARSAQAYKDHLSKCDVLGEETLARFTEFFLRTCIEEAAFLDRLMQPANLRPRVLFWAEQQSRTGMLPPKCGSILEAILYRGELPRGEAESVAGTGERQARRIVSALLESGALRSESPRAPLRLAFPAKLAGHWLPGLFPDQP